MGSPLYNRGIVNAMFAAEAIRTGMKGAKGQVPNTEQIRWGFENLNLTEKRLVELGMAKFTHPIHVECGDHEGSGPGLVQLWGGQKVNIVLVWWEARKDVVHRE